MSEYTTSLSKPSMSGSGRSSGYGSNVRKIVFIVHNFFKNYTYVEKRSRLGFSARQELTAEVCCSSKSTVSRVCTEAKNGKKRTQRRYFCHPETHKFKKERRT
jgi:hypothetical protein